ncbi:hypothetical protein PFICI_10906 [Pestalotiopsis fici W106-1]|uniref:Chromo domain-containing protein n=1 Tax=Pestalotiopsis fici (strain W106-1 / CGMCC3.15140) TaxID=1229662 RepID=W3WV52_PESFW|nr:uncharacterized protein PFICI_10906 [Pestalotiopsis fici W106-1]ETS77032.1 hypothetical protein PFICI_10906 [Pestalotiopsis fici W106-1]
MWRSRLRRRPPGLDPLQPALEARHQTGDTVIATGSFAAAGNTQEHKADETIPSMSSTVSEPSATANHGKNERKRPSSQTPSQSQRSKRRRSGRQDRKKRERPNTLKSQGFWPIKGIVQEASKDDGSSKYLVEWEGEDANGEPWPLEWVSEVTHEALYAWQTEQKAKAAESQTNVGDEEEETQQQEVRPKCTEVLDSQATGESSLETQSFNLLKIEVELKQRPDFDPSAYLAVAASSDSEAHLEDSKGDRIIPDSQEPSAFTTENSGPRVDTDFALLDSLDSQVSETVAEIPSRQPDWVTQRQSPIPEITSFLHTIPSPVPETSAQNSPSENWNLQPLFGPSDFQTQEPCNSLGAATDPEGSQDQSSQTLLSSSLLSRHPQPGIGSFDILSQAAQIVPHTQSQSTGTSSQARLLRDSGENSEFRGDIVLDSSRRSQNRQAQSQSSTQAFIGLHGNLRISSSAPPAYGLGPWPSRSQSSGQASFDESSTTHGTHDIRGVRSASHFSLPAQTSASDFKPSNIAGSRHSEGHRTLVRTMEDPNPPGERRQTLQERMRQLAQINFSGGPADTPPVDAPSPIKSQNLELVHPELPEVPLEPADILHISPSLLVPSVEMEHQDQSLSAFGHETIPLRETVYEYPPVPDNLSHLPDHMSHEQPATLDPSNLTMSIEHDMLGPENDDDGSPSIPTDNLQAPSEHHASPGLTESIHGDVAITNQPNILPFIDVRHHEYIITLPLASNLRPQYVEVIERSNTDLVAYNAAFTVPPYETPDAALVARVDGIFQQLLDICDLPPSLEAIQKMSPEKVSKYMRSTHSKYAFVGSLLEHLQKAEATAPKKILIVARPGAITSLLCTLLECMGYQPCHLRDGEILQDDGAVGAASGSWWLGSLIVTIHPSTDEQYVLQSEYDVVIGFDHTFRRDLLPRWTNEHPISMHLVHTTSIEHLSMRISDNIEPLTRKNYLLLAVCASLPEILNPDLESEEAHEITERFANYIHGVDLDDFYWDHQEPPDSIFEHIAANSQGSATQSNPLPNGSPDHVVGRKRSLDGADETEAEAKRLKTAPPGIITTKVAIAPQVPSTLKSFIGEGVAASDDDSVVQISVSRAKELQAKMAKLKAELASTRRQRDQYKELADRSNKEVESWTASVNRIQPRYMAALRDRGIAHKERDTAQKQHRDLESLLRVTQKDLASTKDALSESKQRLSEAQEALLSGGNPKAAKMVRIEKELEEGRVRVVDAEKRNALAQKDREYASAEYQNASHHAAELAKKNESLNDEIVKLKRLANDNIVKINQTQRNNEVKELLRRIEEKNTIVRELENDLNRAREQNTQLRSGRRETRQSSVPRSPRLAVSSPRGPSRRAATEVASGSASRGASPAFGPLEAGANIIPGVGSIFAGQQQGNGRYAHLRD